MSTPPEVVVAYEGTDVQFDCVVQGKPLPSVGWSKDLEAIPNDSRVRDLGNGSLVIADTKESDTAQYICLFQKVMTGGVEFYSFEFQVMSPTASSTQSSSSDTICKSLVLCGSPFCFCE